MYPFDGKLAITQAGLKSSRKEICKFLFYKFLLIKQELLSKGVEDRLLPITKKKEKKSEKQL